MANDQEKTHQPTAKRLSKARNDGNVAKSQDLGSAAVLISGIAALMAFGPKMGEGIRFGFHAVYNLVPFIELNDNTMPGLVYTGVIFLFKILMPFLIVLAVVAFAINFVQAGWLFTTKPLEPKLNKLDPMKGLKKIFGVRGLMEGAKGIAKVIVVATVGYLSIKSELTGFMSLMDQEVAIIFQSIAAAAVRLGLRLALAMLIIGILDWQFQKWKHNKDLMMSHQEVKDERKQSEGDPKVKSKIRQIQMRTSLNRMIKSLPEADVVVANPIHLAVAIKYDSETMDAPKVIAKGKRKIAEKIKRIARENGIPVIEDPPLARTLYKTTEVGWEIPFDLFQAVAELLAMVYRIKEKVE